MQFNLYRSIWILGAFTLLVSCSKSEKKSAAPGNASRSQLTVDAIVIKPEILDVSYPYTGTLLANEEIDVRPEISGKLTSILFKEGSSVSKGTLLVKMFDKDLQAQLTACQLQIELAEKELKRKTELMTIKGISAEEFDISENKLKTLKANEALLKAQISRTELYAPFSGIVGLKMVSEGAFVSNSTVITTLKQIDPIKLEFSIPEKFISKVQIGKELTFTIEGQDEVFNAKIYAFDSQIDQATRAIKIRALSPNPKRLLYPGFFASIQLNLFPRKETILIPAKASVPLIEGEQLFVLKKGRVKAVQITTGFRSPSAIEVLSGVSVGDTVLVSGLLQVKEGIPVQTRITQN